MSPSQILKGVRILAFTTGYAGPYAGRLLAGYGAEVIKIESKKGGLDTFRHYGQHKDQSQASDRRPTGSRARLEVGCGIAEFPAQGTG
jgi:crotonobetainyl-CoA:carnitine CoA-transferase CaiB-like acyl-CoA transferase